MANQPSPEEIKKLLDQANGIVDPNTPNMSVISPLQRAKLASRVAPQAPVADPVPVAKPVVPVITPDDGGPLEDEELKPVVDPVNVTGSVADLPPSRLDELRKLVESSRSNRTSSNLLADSGQILDKYYSTLGGIKDNSALYTGMKSIAEGDLKDAQTQLQTATLNSTPAPSDFSIEGGPNDGKNVYVSKDGKTFITDDKGAIVPYTPKAGEKMVKMAKTMTDFAQQRQLDAQAQREYKNRVVGQATVNEVAAAASGLKDLKEIDNLSTKVSRGFMGKGMALQKLAQSTDIDGDEARNLQLLGKRLAMYIKDISGAAVSDNERATLLQNMPTADLAPQAFVARLEGSKRDLVRAINSKLKAEAGNGKDTKELRRGLEESLGVSLDEYEAGKRPGSPTSTAAKPNMTREEMEKKRDVLLAKKAGK